MNGLNELVYHVTQNSDFLQEILLNPALLDKATILNSEQTRAFLEIVSDNDLLGHLQNLAPSTAVEIFWRKPWGAIN